MTKKLLFSCVCFLLCAMTAKAAAVSITGQGGWFESAYVTWQKTAGLAYNVYVSPANSNKWTKLDDELVREYPTYGRADALGLMAGSYQFKVVPVSGDGEVAADAAVSSAVEVKAHDRSGFAHKQAGTTGIGAYNNDGTLKANARVVYVWANNAKTVSLDVVKNANGETLTYTGLQNIIYGYQKGDVNGSYEKRPLCVRIIGTILDSDMDAFGSSAEGLQIKGQKPYGPLNITIEGVGNDAGIWGFGILVRNAGRVELRNFAVMLCMDDCISIDTGNTMIWVHNVDFFYGKTGGDADQAKGDGALDFKGDSKYCTFSYNHFFDTGKSNLGGLSESGDNYITLHHNWYDHSDSRHPRIRRMSMHIYNNYFDGNSKYGVGMTTGGSAFVENNYFRNCKYPMLISMQGSDIAGGKGTFSSEDGGIIKSFGNYIKGAKAVVTYQQSNTDFDCWEAGSREAKVPSSVVCKKGGTSYNNFDTDASIMYSYTPDAAADVPTIVRGNYGAGRMQHGDFKWTFNNSVQDTNYGVITELKSALQSYQSTLTGFFGGETIDNGGSEATVDGGDGTNISLEENDNTEASWGGGGGSTSTVTAGKYVIGTKDNYFWFNADNAEAYNKYKTDGNFITDQTFNPQQEVVNSKIGSCSDYIGSVRIASGKSFTAYWAYGIVGVNFYVSSNGSQKWKLEKSVDGSTWTDAGTVEGKTGGHPNCAVSATNNESIKYVRITNQASGNRDLQGIKISTYDPDADENEDPVDEPTNPLSSDATAEFTINGEDIVIPATGYKHNVVWNDTESNYTVKVRPAEGATVAAVTGASGSNGNYTIAAPAPGQTATATFRILAENKANTRSYTINIVKAADPNAEPDTPDDNDTERLLYFADLKLSNTTFYTPDPQNLQFKTRYGSETYKGITSGVSWEPKSGESITFTTGKAATLKIIYGTQSSKKDIKLDGTATTETEIAISAGTHKLEKASAGVEIFFIDVIYADDVLRGDADGNGTVEPADALALANHLIGNPGSYNAKAADVNKDGKVDITDLVALIKKLIP